MGWLNTVIRICCCLNLVCCLACAAAASPDLRTGKPAGTLEVFADSDDPHVWYFAPGDLQLATDDSGKPDLRFLMTRYTGTALTGDQGTFLPHSLLSFRVVMPAPRYEELQMAKQAISPNWQEITLQPLPIKWLEAAVIYTPLVDERAEDAESTNALSDGHFEDSDDSGEAKLLSFWTERLYTIRLDMFSAQAFWEALHKGQIILSVGYAFFADGIAPDRPLDELSGSPDLIRQIRRQLEEKTSPAADTPTPYLVKAGAFPITVDAAKWPELFKQIDINSRCPPNYPVLYIYCYDFNKSLHPDLYAKEVEIEAVGVTGKTISHVVLFDDSQPDIYARNIRFQFAVRMDKPYRYRVTEIMLNGEMHTSDWQERTSWSQILDVTTPKKRNLSQNLSE